MRTNMIFLITVFLRGGLCLRCYGCSGYDDSQPYHKITNNPACADGSFDESQVEVYVQYGSRYTCSAQTYTMGEEKVTHRYMVSLSSQLTRTAQDQDKARVALMGFEEARVEGYFCRTDLCNSADAGASSVASLGVLIMLLALMSRLV